MTRKKKKNELLACLYFLVSDHPWVTIFLATTLIRAPFSQWMSTFFFCINSWKWVSLLINFQQKQSLFVFYQTLHLIFRLFSEKVWIYHLKAIILVLLVLQCLMGIIKISHLLKKKKSYFMERQLTKYWVFVYSYLYFVKVMFGRYH